MLHLGNYIDYFTTEVEKQLKSFDIDLRPESIIIRTSLTVSNISHYIANTIKEVQTNNEKPYFEVTVKHKYGRLTDNNPVETEMSMITDNKEDVINYITDFVNKLR